MWPLIVASIVLAALVYWLLVMTEGVFLGQRIVVHLYDRFAARYDDVKAFDPDDERLLVVEPVLSQLRTREPVVLDVAAGTGRVARFLLADERFDGAIISVEPAAKMLAHARSKTPPVGNQFIRGVAHPLPFPDDLFDLVTCLETLEFLPSDEAALKEMWRVLQPGGALLTTRRCNWEAPFFLHRFRTKANLTHLLERLGYVQPHIYPWQSNYNLVIAYKPLD